MHRKISLKKSLSSLSNEPHSFKPKKNHFILEFRNKVHVYDNNTEQNMIFHIMNMNWIWGEKKTLVAGSLLGFTLKVIYRNFLFCPTCMSESAWFFRKPTSSSSTWLTIFHKSYFFLHLTSLRLQQEFVGLKNSLIPDFQVFL